MRSALIIPAFNEGKRVLTVAEAGQNSQSISEVIVVNDGSTDNTGELLAMIEGVSVLTHQYNKGKGEALDTGMRYAQGLGYEAAVFLDGDLQGVKPEHIDALLIPIREDSYMAIGYLGLRKAVVKKAILHQWGALSGQRAIRTEVWDFLDNQDKHGFNIEAALNARMRKQRLHYTIARVALEGVGHIGKRQKEESWAKGVMGIFENL